MHLNVHGIKQIQLLYFILFLKSVDSNAEVKNEAGDKKKHHVVNDGVAQKESTFNKFYSGLADEGINWDVNSIIQILFFNSEFRQAVYKWDPSSSRTKISKVTGSSIDVIDCSQNVALALQTIFSRMENPGRIRGVSVRTLPLIRALEKTGWDPHQKSEQSTVKLLSTILNILDPLLNGTIDRLFEGTLKEYSSRDKREDQNLKSFKFKHIELQNQGINDLEQVFRAQIDWQPDRNSHGLNNELYRKTDYFSFPTTLILTLNYPVSPHHFHYPNILNLSPYLSSQDSSSQSEKSIWRLQSVAIHSGCHSDENSCQIQVDDHTYSEMTRKFVYVNVEGHWHRFDDDRVKKVRSRMIIDDGDEDHCEESLEECGMKEEGHVHMLVYQLEGVNPGMDKNGLTQDMPNHLPRKIKDYGVAMPCQRSSKSGCKDCKIHYNTEL